MVFLLRDSAASVQFFIETFLLACEARLAAEDRRFLFRGDRFHTLARLCRFLRGVRDNVVVAPVASVSVVTTHAAHSTLCALLGGGLGHGQLSGPGYIPVVARIKNAFHTHRAGSLAALALVEGAIERSIGRNFLFSAPLRVEGTPLASLHSLTLLLVVALLRIHHATGESHTCQLLQSSRKVLEKHLLVDHVGVLGEPALVRGVVLLIRMTATIECC